MSRPRPLIITLKDPSDLEDHGVTVAPEQRPALAAAMAEFPVRLTPHLLELMERSEAVAQQFLPHPAELDDDGGQSRCFSGLLAPGAPSCLERAYLDRCILMPQPACPAHCRFCFRKFYEHERAASADELEAAYAYIAADEALREVLITGGEPILERRLPQILERLRSIEHIATLRIACRSLVTQPGLVDDDFVALLAAHQDLRWGKPVEVALHANHPDELTPPTIDALARLREAGIHVCNQTVLLRGLNLDAAVMLELCRALRRYGVETYHIYFGGPVRGMQRWRPTLDEALALKRALRERGTGRQNPHLIVTTRLGKVELGVDGEVVEREADSQHVWLSTPYSLETLKGIAPSFELPEDARVGREGRLEVRYLDGPAQTLCL